jgi:alkylation response protein AidB-like acyl-CoA dehydrogenase
MQHRLANLRIVLDATRGLLERAASTLDEGSPDARLHIATLCTYAGEALPQFALDCHHGFGAVGYMEEHGMPRRFRRIHADLARHARPAQAATTLGRHLLEHEDGPAYVRRRLPLPPPAERFRRELAAWLDAQKSSEPRPVKDGKSAIRSFDRGFLEAIGQRGYIGVTIERQHGGLGYGPLEQFAFDEEIQFRDAPYYGFAAVQMLAAAIARYGTPTQRARYLPLMLEGKAVFCLGYSEPNAGSDLAAIRTRAERRGEDWVINGQKIWTSLGTVGDYLWLVARTGEVTSRHKGLSIFIVPMTAPGLTIRPLNAMNGEAPCALFMDDLRLPADALIGEVDGGWSVTTYALAQERMLMGSFGSRLALRMSRAIEELRLRSAASWLAATTQVEIGRFAARVEASRWLAHEASVTAARGDATVEAAISKVFASELHEQLAEAVIRWFGADALLSPPAAGTVLAGSIGYELAMGIMYVVGGGSNDIQRNIIAQRGLGLPR